jgi:hypothetical protein
MIGDCMEILKVWQNKTKLILISFFFSTQFSSGVAAELKQIILLETMDVKVVRD